MVILSHSKSKYMEFSLQGRNIDKEGRGHSSLKIILNPTLMNTSNLYVFIFFGPISQCGNYGNLLSQFFDKKFRESNVLT